MKGGYEGRRKTIRLDHLIVQRGLAGSGARAQALILAGRIRAPGVKNIKPGERVSPDQELELIEDLPYVSRGGVKLAAALKEFGIVVSGRSCVDIGASTGGFTDCLLQNGAEKVLAVDVGHGQLHWKLRRDSRVVNREKTHVLKLTREDVEGGAPPLVTVDVSFISLEKVLPHLAEIFPSGTEFVVLVKPQFEVGPKQAPKGVVKDPEVHRMVVDRIMARAEKIGFVGKGRMPSPITGPEGNREFLVHFLKAAV